MISKIKQPLHSIITITLLCFLSVFLISCNDIESISKPDLLLTKQKPKQIYNESNKLILVLIGGPGVGKGTQAVLLAKYYQIPHLSTGEMLRAMKSSNSDLGIEVASYINSGKLVPDHLINKVVTKRIKDPDCQDGFILDGYPRTVEQAVFLDELLSKNVNNYQLAIVYLSANDEEVIGRIRKRSICAKCNTGELSPLTNSLCNDCTGNEVSRSDDNEKIVSERLKLYNKQILPILNYYHGKENFINTNAISSINQIFENVVANIGKKQDNIISNNITNSQ